MSPREGEDRGRREIAQRRAATEAERASPSGIELACERLRALTGVPVDRMVAMIHEGEPVPKARPRHNGRQTYTPSATRAAESSLAWSIKAALRGHRFRSNVALLAVFYRSTRRRTDSDNLAKTVLDSATKAGAWLDDSQVTTQVAIVELDRARPRTVLVLCECASSMDRSTEET